MFDKDKIRLSLSAGLVLAFLQLAWAQSPALAQPLVKAADNHIHAQAVLNAVLKANPDMVAIALHAVPPGIKAEPGDPQSQVIAQSADVIGAKDAPNDLEVVKLDQIRINLAPLAGTVRMKVAMPLRDGSQRIIGLAVLSFRPTPDMTKMKAHQRADTILAEFARQFPDRDSLFLPEGQ
jgi:hypothetical protein